ncbi:hypothetical protein ABWL39_19785 [Chitinivorax sp. PXF-14]|uniref:hypothetical protein n=1 Tax=Chitinivorax sp. PXF-14 TaxID=3230488 RepID=UPI003465D37A
MIVKHLRWMSETRYYTATLYYDLLGDLLLMRSYGGRASRLGQIRITSMQSEAEGRRKLAALDKLRRKHNYTLLTGNS